MLRTNKSGTYGLTEFFNAAHYEKVTAARQKAGLPSGGRHDAAFIPGHTLVDCELKHILTGERVRITCVEEVYQLGTYFLATGVNEHTHDTVTLVVGNRNCRSPKILSQLQEFESLYELAQ